MNKRIGATDPEYIFDGLWEIEERSEINEDNEMGGALGKSRMPGKKVVTNLLTATYNPNISMNMSYRKPTAPKK